MIEFLVTFFKYAGIFVSGVAGILGTATETKQAGKLTRWGRVALGMAVAGFVVALGAQITDNAKQIKDEKQRVDLLEKQSREMLDTLTAVRRTQTQFRQIGLWVKFELPCDDVDIQAYQRALLESVKTYTSPELRAGVDLGRLSAAGWTSTGAEDRVTELRIAPDSKYAPASLGRRWLDYFIENAGVELAIYHSAQQRYLDLANHPSRRATVGDFRAHTEPVRGSFDIGTDAPSISFERQMSASPFGWYSSGRITSVDDLGGAELVVAFHCPGDEADHGFALVERLRGRTTFDLVELTVNGIRIPLNGFQVYAGPGLGGEFTRVYRLPADTREFNHVYATTANKNKAAD